MEIKLHAVQRTALNNGGNKAGFAYFLEMGLGKTLINYMDFLSHVAMGEVTRMVIVCPNSFKGGHKIEAAKWELKVDVHVYESGNIHMNNAFLKKKFDRPPVLVVNYEAIRSPTTQSYIRRFIQDRNAWITFDESIQLKNNKAAQTKAALTLAKFFKFRRILSGKPTTQGPHDYWGQLRAIGLLDGMNYYSFRTSFCQMGGYMNKKVIGTQNSDILAEIIQPHAFYATKEEWLDLPIKTYTVRDYQLTAEMKHMYQQMEQEFVLWLNEEEYVAVDAAISKYIKLAQIQCGFIIREDGSIQELVEPTNNPRIKLIKELIDEEVTGKVVIPYHHRYMFEILTKVFTKYNSAYIRGGMSETQISSEKEKFNNDPTCRLIFVQLTAGRYGHTLLGGNNSQDKCSTMIFAENTYSLDTRSQIEDRIHRIGQSFNCTYVDLVGTPLDRRVVLALQAKEEIYQSIIRAINSYRSRASSPTV